jgi:predicted esterase
MKCLCLAISLFLHSWSYAQEVYHFTKGLSITAANRYGREAIYTDQLAYKLYANTLLTPKEGDTLGTNDSGQPVRWQTVVADSINRFRMRGGLGGGSSSYLYLTYRAEKERTALLHVKGNSGLYFNGEPHAGDAYAAGYLYIPVQLKKGLNELYVRGGQITADLIFPAKSISINTEDPTLPHIVLNKGNNVYLGAIVVINASDKPLKGVQLKATLPGINALTPVPVVPPMSTRKIPFWFHADHVTEKGQQTCTVSLVTKEKVLDEQKIMLEAVPASDKHSNTFISNIDGSVQYYAVTPQLPAPQRGAALFLSVHGAGVEAIGQARAYQHKDWGTLVAATNRRPRGFNWEDWGRLDALEVLEIAKQQFQPDPQRIYLTGHSMGGHGTWFLGATYPDKWAGIGPCSGYPTLKGYGSADGLIPDSSRSPMEQMLLRAGNQSDVLKLVNNYKPLGIYVLHGDADRVVSVRYARQMRKLLADFHTDLSYYEYPNGEHWFGDQSVDWKPLFDFFKWHSRLPDSSVDVVDFTTSSPGISDAYRWASVQQQEQPLQYSRMQLTRNKNGKTISGTTENIQLLKLALNDFGSGAAVTIKLDSQELIQYTTTSNSDSLYLLKQNNRWITGSRPALSQKGPHRYGTFKEAFKNRMVFVYGTTGTAAENAWSFNKARYDAETWYYRGNGAVDMVADKQFSPAAYAGRSVILYGNAITNAAWKLLLNDCPIQITGNKITAGNKVWEGDDLGAYFIWPLQQSPTASVAVISGTGLKGMHAATANQYFAGGSGFPDFMIFSLDMLQQGAQGIKWAGFFDNNWKLVE